MKVFERVSSVLLACWRNFEGIGIVAQYIVCGVILEQLGVRSKIN
jgi:hypothetical protein